MGWEASGGPETAQRRAYSTDGAHEGGKSSAGRVPGPAAAVASTCGGRRQDYVTDGGKDRGTAAIRTGAADMRCSGRVAEPLSWNLPPRTAAAAVSTRSPRSPADPLRPNADEILRSLRVAAGGDPQKTAPMSCTQPVCLINCGQEKGSFACPINKIFLPCRLRLRACFYTRTGARGPAPRGRKPTSLSSNRSGRASATSPDWQLTRQEDVWEPLC